MDMLKSEVKLLLLRNNQLENENLLLKRNELQLNECVLSEKQLNKVLENIKLWQNQYISKLNALLVELTEENTGNQLNYNQIKRDINKCIKVCKQLQNEYELSKRSVNGFNQKFLENNESFDSTQDLIQTLYDRKDDHSDNEDIPEAQDMSEEEEDQPMPELDLMDVHNDNFDDNTDVEEDDDDDPNGAGEQYLDITDTEFIPKLYPKGVIPKGARKSFMTNANRLSICHKRKKSDKRGFKTSQKFGDKFKCNWKTCPFISSYKQNVERHYRVHTGERPFKCQYKSCTFSASQAGNLKVHQQRHGHQTPNAVKIRVKSTHNAVRTSPNTKTPNKE